MKGAPLHKIYYMLKDKDHFRYANIVMPYSSLLVGCFEDLRRLNDLSAISRLGSRRLPISEIVVARPGIEPRTSCSTSQELSHYTTAAPPYSSRSISF